MSKPGPGTLRAEGKTSITLDKPTRAKLKELAGDMPVSRYVKGLAFGYIKPGGGAQEVIPGQEALASPATIHAVNDKLNTIARAICLFFGMPPDNIKALSEVNWQDFTSSKPGALKEWDYSWVGVLADKVADRIKARSVAEQNIQSELELT